MFSCETCPKKFRDNCALRKHLRICVPKPKKFECPQCGKPVRDQFNFDRHMKTHQKTAHLGEVMHPSKDQSYQCESDEATLEVPLPPLTLANEQLKRVKSKKIKKTSHNSLKQIRSSNKIKCPECPKVFRDRDMMKRHFRRWHENPHECYFCRKTLYEKESALEHQRVCLGFKCEECGKSFRSAQKFTKHSRSHVIKEFKHQRDMQVIILLWSYVFSAVISINQGVISSPLLSCKKLHFNMSKLQDNIILQFLALAVIFLNISLLRSRF